jgi:hypothetical protein
MKSEERIKREIEILYKQKENRTPYFIDIISDRIETLKWVLEDD